MEPYTAYDVVALARAVLPSGNVRSSAVSVFRWAREILYPPTLFFKNSNQRCSSVFKRFISRLFKVHGKVSSYESLLWRYANISNNSLSITMYSCRWYLKTSWIDIQCWSDILSSTVFELLKHLITSFYLYWMPYALLKGSSYIMRRVCLLYKILFHCF